jgi:O-methyltransferase involved in polyketide biosynthesis
MARIDQGPWHFATSVGATATVTAVRQALTSHSPEVRAIDSQHLNDPEAAVSCREGVDVGD